MTYDVVIVGGGASGLTAGAYLSKYGQSTLLLEKEAKCGGLVNSFKRGEFTFDGGIRALENAGALFPLLKQLGIQMDFVKNRVSIGIEDQVITIDSDVDIHAYEKLLESLYPESSLEINAIMADIKKISHYMDIQYGIDNPLFLDIKEDRDYFIKEVFPWMLKYAWISPKVARKNQPVVPYLKQFTTNQALLDIITQHFFQGTPAYFALSYFTLYQDYYYPKGGTGEFSQKLVHFIKTHGGEIRTNAQVQSIDLTKKTVKTSDEQEFGYRQLLWAADQKALYQLVNIQKSADKRISEIIQEKGEQLSDMKGNDSVLTLYLTTQLEKSYFEDISTGHFFYTPTRKGLSSAGNSPVNGTWDDIHEWLEKFFALNTFEISIPALRENALAPSGKTGLIISTLFDYHLTKTIYDHGWGDKFKTCVTDLMIRTLENSIYPGLRESILDSFISTPLTIQKMAGTTDGAITGWAFTNQSMPAENRLIKIGNAVKTLLPNVSQAGQWTYSPSGFPVALITGKLAADQINKRLKQS